MGTIIIGPFKIDSISGGIVVFGNTKCIAPVSVTNETSGAGNSVVGDNGTVLNGTSTTNSFGNGSGR